jgi:hypothetical protein
MSPSQNTLDGVAVTQDLEAVKNKLFELHESQRYQEALDLSRSVRETHPANASYWSACLLSLVGETEESITTLERALVAGYWWSPDALRRDPDLEPLRSDVRFTRVVEASEDRWRAAFRVEPELVMFPPKGASSGVLLIALHGSPAFSLDDFAAQWEPLTSRGIALVVPRSSQAANSDGGATWDDRARTERDLRLAHERAKSRFGTTRVVIAGFSAGGEAAITASVMDQPAIRPIGFIAVAARIHPDVPAALAQADPSLRGWIIVGDNDWARDGCVALAEQARVVGLPWHIEVVEGIGHRFPAEFSSRLERATDFILSTEAH